MNKLIFSVALFSLIFTSSSLASTGVSAGMGGAVGYSRNTLRTDDGTFILGNPTPGLNLIVGMNPVMDMNGMLMKPATWGFEFGTDFVADRDITVTRLTQKIWSDWKRVRLVGGTVLAFADPGIEGGMSILPETTNFVGGNAAMRFKAADIPAEFGGSYVQRYDGSDNADSITEVHLSIVGEF